MGRPQGRHLCFSQSRGNLKMRVSNAIRIGFAAFLILGLAGCGNTNSELDTRVESLPTKGNSLSYEGVYDHLNQLDNAQNACSRLAPMASQERVHLLQQANASGRFLTWTDAEWTEFELVYLAACYQHELWPDGTIASMDATALSGMIRVDPDTPAYCSALEGLSDDRARALLRRTHTGPLYVSLAEIEDDQIAMQSAYLAACQSLATP